MEIDLEEELNRIKLEFDQKFGATGMTFDELPDDLESMLNTYSVGGGSISTNQPYNDSASRGQSYAYDFEYESPRQQQPARAQARPAPTSVQQAQPASRNNTQNFGGGGGGGQLHKQPSTTQPLQKAPSQPMVQKSQSHVLKAKQDEDQYRIQAELDIELDRYLEEEGFVDDGNAEDDEFDDALPPLEDMLLLITNPKIHEKYNYQLPKRIPYAMQQQLLEKQQQEQAHRLAMEQASRSAGTNRAQPAVQAQRNANIAEVVDALPDLAQPAWSVRDCNTLVQYLKKLLMGVLQDALVVKKMDLTDNYNTPKAESIFKKTGGSLKEAREIIDVIARIDTQDANHLDIQASVQALSDTMIKSTVVMLRTAMNVTKGVAVVDQFANAYSPFFNDARALISEVNLLAFDTWGPNEVFFA